MACCVSLFSHTHVDPRPHYVLPKEYLIHSTKILPVLSPRTPVSTNIPFTYYYPPDFADNKLWPTFTLILSTDTIVDLHTGPKSTHTLYSTMLPQSFYLVLPFASLGMGAIITEYVTVKTMTYVNAPAAPTIQAAVQPPAIVHGSLNPLHSHTSNKALTDAVLNSVNVFRKQHNASPLSWNDTLASYAANHVSGCVFQHTKGPYGENLAAGTDQSVEAAVDSWANERASYGFANSGFSMGTGHFTQLVWKDTTSVGCGRVYCNRPGTPGWFLMCEFYPAVSCLLSSEQLFPSASFSRVGDAHYKSSSPECWQATFRVMSSDRSRRMCRAG